MAAAAAAVGGELGSSSTTTTTTRSRRCRGSSSSGAMMQRHHQQQQQLQQQHQSQRRRRGLLATAATATPPPRAGLLLLLLALACAVPLLPGAAAAASKKPPKPAAAAECVARTYAELYRFTTLGNCSFATIRLACTANNGGVFSRDARGALELDVPVGAPKKQYTIVGGDASCTPTIWVDLSANAALPVLTVHGDNGIKSVTLSNVNVIVGGDMPAVPGGVACGGGALQPPCVSPLNVIDIHDVANVTVDRLSISNDRGVVMPINGLQVSNSVNGGARFDLTNLTVTNAYEGLRIIGGGNVNAENIKLTGCRYNGLSYSCAFLTGASLVHLHGDGSSYSRNGGDGAFINCDGDLGQTLDVLIDDRASFRDNQQRGITLFGHLHTRMSSQVRVSGNGRGSPPPECGGGIHAHFKYGSPEMWLNGTVLTNNTALWGGGLCVEVPEDYQAFTKVRGPISLTNVRMTYNRATYCGGAFATVANASRGELDVDVRTHNWAFNAAPRGAEWCMLDFYDYSRPTSYGYSITLGD